MLLGFSMFTRFDKTWLAKIFLEYSDAVTERPLQDSHQQLPETPGDPVRNGRYWPQEMATKARNGVEKIF
jgi:hypothetical protein